MSTSSSEELDKNTAKAVLEALVYAIEMIHGQCFMCADKFVADANPKLAAIDCPYCYYVLDCDDEPTRTFEMVRVVETKGAQCTLA